MILLSIAREIAQRHRGEDLTARRDKDRLTFCLILATQEHCF